MSRTASNWVDRGDPLEDILARVLGHALNVVDTDARLAEHVLTVRGLVEADATEVHVARFVRTLLPLFAQPDADARLSRTLGIALWHIAKVGLVLRAPNSVATREPAINPVSPQAQAKRRR